MQSRRRKYTEMETLFGHRVVVFVKYPFNWTGHKVVSQLDWAKSYDVAALYDGFTVKCYVKPHYLKHFIKDNKEYTQWHVHIVADEGTDDEMHAWEVDGVLYD